LNKLRVILRSTKKFKVDQRTSKAGHGPRFRSPLHHHWYNGEGAGYRPFFSQHLIEKYYIRTRNKVMNKGSDPQSRIYANETPAWLFTKLN